MKVRRIHVTAQTPAGAAAIYGLLADGSSWPRWSPIESVSLEQPGDPRPEGVGAVRALGRGRIVGRDQILDLVPGRRFAYASRSGLPVRDYVGEVDLADDPGGGTTIHWRASFSPKVPGTGWLLERGITRFLDECAHGLAAYSAASSDADAA